MSPHNLAGQSYKNSLKNDPLSSIEPTIFSTEKTNKPFLDYRLMRVPTVSGDSPEKIL